MLGFNGPPGDTEASDLSGAVAVNRVCERIIEKEKVVLNITNNWPSSWECRWFKLL